VSLDTFSVYVSITVLSGIWGILMMALPGKASKLMFWDRGAAKNSVWKNRAGGLLVFAISGFIFWILVVQIGHK
jgi:hypothetical protein